MTHAAHKGRPGAAAFASVPVNACTPRNRVSQPEPTCMVMYFHIRETRQSAALRSSCPAWHGPCISGIIYTGCSRLHQRLQSEPVCPSHVRGGCRRARRRIGLLQSCLQALSHVTRSPISLEQILGARGTQHTTAALLDRCVIYRIQRQ